MLRKIITAFAEETSVFGLHLFKTPRGRIESLFWCTFVVVFSCYTTKTLVNICVKYADEEVVTVVQQMRDDPFLFPAPTLFVDIDGAANANIDDVLEQYFRTGDVNTSDTLTAIQYINDLQNREYSLLDAVPQKLYRGDRENFTFSILEKVEKASVSGSLERVFHHSSDRHLSDFSDFVIEKLCRSLGLSVLFAGSNNASTLIASCRREQLDISSGIASIKIALNRTLAVFNATDDTLIIRIGTGLLNVSHLSFDLNTNDDDAAPDSQTEIALNRQTIYYVRLSTVYQNLDLRRRPCDVDSELGVFCKSFCKLHFFLETFGCVPFYFLFIYQFSSRPQNLSELHRCEAENYLNFSYASASLEVMRRLANCKDACRPLCTTQVFVVEWASDTPSDMTTAWIRVATHVYPLVAERLARDFEAFLGDFGGALGLWLGVSMASLIHIPVFAFRVLVKLSRKNEPSGDSSPRQEQHRFVSVEQYSTLMVELQTLKGKVNDRLEQSDEALILKIVNRLQTQDVPGEPAVADL